MSTQTTYARRLVKGSAIIYVALLVSGVIGLLLRMFLARSLLAEDIAIGVEEGTHYGLVYAVFAIISFFEIFRGLGFDTALTKYIPEFMVKKRFDKIKSSITLVLLLRVALGFLIAAVFFIFSHQLALGIIKTIGMPPAVAVSLIQILAIWFIVTGLSTLIVAFQGLQNMPAYALVKFFDTLSVFLLAILLVGGLGLGVTGIASAYLLTALATPMLCFAVLRRKYPEIFKVKAPLTKPLVKKLSKFALLAFLTGIVSLVLGYADTLMIIAFRTPYEVGYYQVAQPMSNLLFTVVGSVLIVFSPMVSELWARREKKLLGNMLHFLTKFSFILVTPAVLVFIAFPEIIIRMFFSPGYLAGTVAFQILSVTAIFHLFIGILGYTLTGIGKLIITAKVTALMAGFNLVANLLLIPPYGIEGAAAASLGTYLLGSILLFYYARKFVRFTVPASPLLKTAIGGALTLLLILGLKSIIVLPPWLMMFVIGILSFVFYVVWILATKTVTKDDLRTIARIIPMPKWLIKAARKVIGE